MPRATSSTLDGRCNGSRARQRVSIASTRGSISLSTLDGGLGGPSSCSRRSTSIVRPRSARRP
ncbi:MAG: hypothetical protein ACKVXR_09280, partial [Planctomycetota bacterium]